MLDQVPWVLPAGAAGRTVDDAHVLAAVGVVVRQDQVVASVPVEVGHIKGAGKVVLAAHGPEEGLARAVVVEKHPRAGGAALRLGRNREIGETVAVKIARHQREDTVELHRVGLVDRRDPVARRAQQAEGVLPFHHRDAIGAGPGEKPADRRAAQRQPAAVGLRRRDQATISRAGSETCTRIRPPYHDKVGLAVAVQVAGINVRKRVGTENRRIELSGAHKMPGAVRPVDHCRVRTLERGKPRRRPGAAREHCDLRGNPGRGDPAHGRGFEDRLRQLRLVEARGLRRVGPRHGLKPRRDRRRTRGRPRQGKRIGHNHDFRHRLGGGGRGGLHFHRRWGFCRCCHLDRHNYARLHGADE